MPTPNITPEQKARIIARTPENERDARRVIGFWLRFSDQISKARAVADFAQKDGSEAKTLADQAHTRITTLDHNFGVYRERVAMEYVSKEAMRELKTDLVNAIDAIGAKLDMVLSYERGGN